MTDNQWRPRLSITITDKQYRKLQQLIPWGVKGQLFSALIDDLIKALEVDGEKVLGGILSRKLKLEDYSNIGGDKDE